MTERGFTSLTDFADHYAMTEEAATILIRRSGGSLTWDVRERNGKGDHVITREDARLAIQFRLENRRRGF